MSGTLIPPPAGIAGEGPADHEHQPATPAALRKPRCRVLDRHRNPCPNPEISEGYCLRHLAAAHAIYEELLAAAQSGEASR